MALIKFVAVLLAAAASCAGPPAVAQRIDLPPIIIPAPRNVPPASNKSPSIASAPAEAYKAMPEDVRKMASQYVRSSKACDIAVAGGQRLSAQCKRRDDLVGRMGARGWPLASAMGSLSDECSAKGRAAQIAGGIRGAGQSPQIAFAQAGNVQGIHLDPAYMKTLVNYIYFGEGRAFGPFELDRIASNACYFGPNDDPAWQPIQ